MADVFALEGAWSLSPASGFPSLDPSVTTPIDEQVQLVNKEVGDLNLTVDTPVAVNFGAVSPANVLILKAFGGPVTATITWSGGTSQVIPFDSYLILVSLTNGITAISLTRQPATLTQVRTLLGQQA
jgi:hypothetical protein